jgi:predicted MFS family arabinose efflux permease
MLSQQLAVPEYVPARTPLITHALLLRFVSIIGAASSFYLPLSVVPLYAKSAGTDAGAGLAAGALLLATVGVELLTPRLVGKIGYRFALALGLLLLGLPALALLAPPDLAVIVAVSVVRGAGFAVVTVAGGALTASLIPSDRRGAGLALTGIVSGVPALACLPLGVWVSARWGFTPVFVATAAAAILALTAVPGTTQRRRAGHGTVEPGTAHDAPAHGILPALTTPSLTGPAALFSASTMATGVLVTFLPLAITQRSAAVATFALFAQPAAATLARVVAGRLGDRHGHARLLHPGIALSAAGMAAITATGTPALVIGGAAVFGLGFGLLQNATAALMYARSVPSGYAAVSALWNAAYDAGMGAGAIGMGLITGHLGYPATFLLTGALVLLALIPASREHRRSAHQ